MSAYELQLTAATIRDRADRIGYVLLTAPQAVALAALLEGQAFQGEAGNPTRDADAFAAAWRGKP